MSNAGGGTGEPRGAVRSRKHGVREPNVGSGPAHRLGVGERRHPEAVDAELLLVHRLGEMCVHRDARVTRQIGRCSHEVGRDRERRTGGDHDPHHRTGVGIVVSRDDPLGVVENRLWVFDDRIRGKATVALTKAHRTA